MAFIRKPDRLLGLEVNEIFRRTGAAVKQASGNKQVPAVYSQFFGTAYFSGKSGPQVSAQSVNPSFEWGRRRLTQAA